MERTRYLLEAKNMIEKGDRTQLANFLAEHPTIIYTDNHELNPLLLMCRYWFPEMITDTLRLIRRFNLHNHISDLYREMFKATDIKHRDALEAFINQEELLFHRPDKVAYIPRNVSPVPRGISPARQLTNYALSHSVLAPRISPVRRYGGSPQRDAISPIRERRSTLSPQRPNLSPARSVSPTKLKRPSVGSAMASSTTHTTNMPARR